jgi:hypothetical protein
MEGMEGMKSMKESGPHLLMGVFMFFMAFMVKKEGCSSAPALGQWLSSSKHWTC